MNYKDKIINTCEIIIFKKRFHLHNNNAFNVLKM